MKNMMLVVGARPLSVGEAVAVSAKYEGYHVVTMGLHDEDERLDLAKDSVARMRLLLAQLRPQHIVCTAGINVPEGDDEDPTEWYQRHFAVNVIGPMRLLGAWRDLLRQEGVGGHRHFVAISSNSAHVPRSQSAAYCASKAALSMALRVKAREVAGSGSTVEPFVYGYEPGLIAQTPMTKDTVAQFGTGVPLTRMRDPRLAGGYPPSNLGWMIVNNLVLGPEVNGVMFRLDADEA